jgi:hypothetical protein
MRRFPIARPRALWISYHTIHPFTRHDYGERDRNTADRRALEDVLALVRQPSGAGSEEVPGRQQSAALSLSSGGRFHRLMGLLDKAVHWAPFPAESWKRFFQASSRARITLLSVSIFSTHQHSTTLFQDNDHAMRQFLSPCCSEL